jgi:hypothetical protein
VLIHHPANDGEASSALGMGHFQPVVGVKRNSHPLGNIRQGGLGHQQGIGNRAGIHWGFWCWQILGPTLQGIEPATERGDGAGVAVYEYCNILIALIGAVDQVQQNPGVIVAAFCATSQAGQGCFGEGAHGWFSVVGRLQRLTRLS